MTADQIRALYIEVLAKNRWQRGLGRRADQPNWDDNDLGFAAIKDAYRKATVPDIDALVASGLLPVYMDRRMACEPNGDPLGYFERQFLTEWRMLDDSCPACGAVWGDCRPPDRRCCASCSHPFREHVRAAR